MSRLNSGSTITMIRQPPPNPFGQGLQNSIVDLFQEREDAQAAAREDAELGRLLEIATTEGRDGVLKALAEPSPAQPSRGGFLGNLLGGVIGGPATPGINGGARNPNREAGFSSVLGALFNQPQQPTKTASNLKRSMLMEILNQEPSLLTPEEQRQGALVKAGLAPRAQAPQDPEQQRLEELQVTKAERENSPAYLEYQRQQQVFQDEIEKLRASTAQTNATTARMNADNTRRKLDTAANPSPEAIRRQNIKDQQEVVELQIAEKRLKLLNNPQSKQNPDFRREQAQEGVADINKIIDRRIEEDPIIGGLRVRLKKAEDPIFGTEDPNTITAAIATRRKEITKDLTEKRDRFEQVLLDENKRLAEVPDKAKEKTKLKLTGRKVFNPQTNTTLYEREDGVLVDENGKPYQKTYQFGG